MLAIIILTLLVYSPAGVAAVWIVDSTASIQAAADQAADGDTILLRGGLFSETVVLYGRTLTLASLCLMDGDTSHIENTVIVPDHSRPDTGSCIVIIGQGPDSVRLVGLTLRDGTGTWLDVPGPDDGFAGGAIFIMNASLRIENCRIYDCRASRNGGGIFVIGEDSLIPVTVSLEGSVIAGCQTDGWGGGIYAQDCSLRVFESRFLADTSLAGSGALDFGDVRSAIQHCVFNGCYGEVGGVVAFGGSHVIEDTDFVSNICISGGIGSHLVLFEATAHVSRCIFAENGLSGMAISIDSRRGRGVRFRGNVIRNNIANPYTGTLIIQGGLFDIGYNYFHHNHNAAGGVIFTLPYARLRLHHNWFEANTAIDLTGGTVIRNNTNTVIAIDSNAFVQNIGTTIFQEAPPSGDPQTVDARHNWWGDATGPFHPIQNPEGRGDTLLQDSILFSPWLMQPPDTTLPLNRDRRERQEISSTWRLVALYPNPFNREMRMIIAGFTGSDFRMVLHNLLGQEVDTIHSGPLTGGEFRYQAPSGLATGVYFVRASTEGYTETRKVFFLK